MRVEPEGAALTFAARLGRENGWNPAYAEAVFAEYRRFLYLAAASDRPVTPPEDVDQAWHLHLSYTRHYWDELCARTLGRPLHHEPTAGGREEAARYRGQYEATLWLYRETFGAPPPPDIWPDAGIRFATRPQWVDRARYWLMPKALFGRGAALATATTLLAACTMLTANTSGGGGVATALGLGLGALLVLAVSFVVFVAFSERERKKDDRDGNSGGCGTGAAGCGNDASGCGGGGGCGGGCGS